MDRQHELNGIIVRMYGVMGGAFTVVRVETKNGRTLYSKAHRFTTDAEADYRLKVNALTAGL